MVLLVCVALRSREIVFILTYALVTVKIFLRRLQLRGNIVSILWRQGEIRESLPLKRHNCPQIWRGVNTNKSLIHDIEERACLPLEKLYIRDPSA
jgi:hypothetical protein